jgi:hypothetical protein
MGQDGVQQYQEIYVKPENFDLLSPEDQQLFRLYRTQSNRAQQKSREAKKAKAAAF